MGKVAGRPVQREGELISYPWIIAGSIFNSPRHLSLKGLTRGGGRQVVLVPNPEQWNDLTGPAACRFNRPANDTLASGSRVLDRHNRC